MAHWAVQRRRERTRFAQKSHDWSYEIIKKILLYVFFDYNGEMYRELFLEDLMVNGECFFKFLVQPLAWSYTKNHPNLRQNISALHNDNTPTHTSLILISSLKTVIIPQAPYSPDLAPGDFFLFANLKKLKLFWRKKYLSSHLFLNTRIFCFNTHTD